MLTVSLGNVGVSILKDFNCARDSGCSVNAATALLSVAGVLTALKAVNSGQSSDIFLQKVQEQRAATPSSFSHFNAAWEGLQVNTRGLLCCPNSWWAKHPLRRWFTTLLWNFKKVQVHLSRVSWGDRWGDCCLRPLCDTTTWITFVSFTNHFCSHHFVGYPHLASQGDVSSSSPP